MTVRIPSGARTANLLDLPAYNRFPAPRPYLQTNQNFSRSRNQPRMNYESLDVTKRKLFKGPK